MFTTPIAPYFQTQRPLGLSAGLVMTCTWTATWYPFQGARGAVSGSSKLRYTTPMRIFYLNRCAVNLNLQDELFSSLAYSELYLAFSSMFRCLDMQLYETTSDDMKWGDYFSPITKKNLKVKILSSTHLAFDKMLA